ncbi:hypothetical protein ACFE04_010372 [Oxalis oulophora]
MLLYHRGKLYKLSSPNFRLLIPTNCNQTCDTTIEDDIDWDKDRVIIKLLNSPPLSIGFTIDDLRWRTVWWPGQLLDSDDNTARMCEFPGNDDRRLLITSSDVSDHRRISSSLSSSPLVAMNDSGGEGERRLINIYVGLVWYGMFPGTLNQLARFQKYVVDIEGRRVKVFVVPTEGLVDTHVSELSKEILQSRLVGVDLKYDKFGKGLLLLFVETRCLIVQFSEHMRKILSSLKNFLVDARNFFVGVNLSSKKYYLTDCKTWVDLNEFVARVLQSPKLLSEKVPILATEVGLKAESFSPMPLPSSNWTAKVFSKQ